MAAASQGRSSSARSSPTFNRNNTQQQAPPRPQAQPRTNPAAPNYNVFMSKQESGVFGGKKQATSGGTGAGGGGGGWGKSRILTSSSLGP